MQKFQIFLKSFSFLHNFSKFHHYSNQKQIMYVILYKTYSSENVLQWFNPFWPEAVYASTPNLHVQI